VPDHSTGYEESTTQWNRRAAVEQDRAGRVHAEEPVAVATEQRMTNARHNGCAFDGWQCFHCGEIFETVGGARDHFGFDQSSDPACRIKLGAERGLLMALREAEKSASEAWGKLHNESSDAVVAMRAMDGRHRKQFEAAENLGYERGLRDAIPQPSAPAEQQAQRRPLTDEQVQQLIEARHFRKGYILADSDRVALDWYRRGLRDGEFAHGIGEQAQEEQSRG